MLIMHIVIIIIRGIIRGIIITITICIYINYFFLFSVSFFSETSSVVPRDTEGHAMVPSDGYQFVFSKALNRIRQPLTYLHSAVGTLPRSRDSKDEEQ